MMMMMILVILILLQHTDSLTPNEALRLNIFDNFTQDQQSIQKAVLRWTNPDYESVFYKMSAVASRSEVNKIRDILDHANIDFNNEPDTVDALPSHEVFVHEGKNDVSEELGGDFGRSSERVRLRTRLREIMDPIEERITKIVRETYPEVCDQSPERQCRACFSLVRRYAPDERRNHGMHRDGYVQSTGIRVSQTHTIKTQNTDKHLRLWSCL